MAISQAMATSFKQELLNGTHDFTNDTFKVALYSEEADLGSGTTAYTTTDEVTGTGYSAGGKALTAVAPTTDGTTAFVDFDDVTWTLSTITARGALIYNSSKANRAVAVMDFGENRESSNGDFRISFPTANAEQAMVRIS